MRKTFIIYSIGIILCLSILIWVLKLWKTDLSVPFVYAGDGLFYAMTIKGVIDHGWFLHNPSLGMPFGLDMHDFPMSDNFHFLLIRVISLFSSDYAMTMNLYYLLTFPLTTLLSLFVFRQLKFSCPTSMVGSLLFTFLPIRFLRGEGHLFLVSYYLIPLMVLVILWIISGALSLINYSKTKCDLELNLLNYKSVLSIMICVLIASSGVYYAFFSCFFLIIAGMMTFLNGGKKIYPLLGVGILIGIVCFVLILNISPNLIYQYQHGKNIEVALRHPMEAELYGLKLTQLFLPIDDYGFGVLSKLKAKYTLSVGNEYIGFIGSLGFVLLILKLLKKNNIEEKESLLEHISKLNLFAVLLGTIGGFGSMFALIISPEIRAYERISIYIAFFSIFAVIIIFEISYELYFKKRGGLKYGFNLFLFFVLIIGIYDQTNWVKKNLLPILENLKSEYIADKEFINKIEGSVNKNALIFQFPFVQFPESPPVHKIGDYDHFRTYLHSKTLRWSYGAMKGREADLWQKEVLRKQINELVSTLSLVGFSGIYINRDGYPDGGVKIEGELRNLLGIEPISSDNGRLIFFNLERYNKNMKEKYTEAEWEMKKESVLYPIMVFWIDGFYGLEGNPENSWRWCSNQGKIMIRNMSRRQKKIKLEMVLTTGYDQMSNLRIKSPFFEENIQVNANGQLYSKTIDLPPGKYFITFKSDAKQVLARGDPRDLYFAVLNFKVKEE